VSLPRLPRKQRPIRRGGRCDLDRAGARPSASATTTRGARGLHLAGHVGRPKRGVNAVGACDYYSRASELRRPRGPRWEAMAGPCRTWAWWPSTRATLGRRPSLPRAGALTLAGHRSATVEPIAVSNTNFGPDPLLPGRPGRCPCARSRRRCGCNLEVAVTHSRGWWRSSAQQPRQRLARPFGEQGARCDHYAAAARAVLGECGDKWGTRVPCSRCGRCAFAGMGRAESAEETDRRRGPCAERSARRVPKRSKPISRSPGVRGGRAPHSSGPLGSAARARGRTLDTGAGGGCAVGPGARNHRRTHRGPGRGRVLCSCAGNPVAFFSCRGQLWREFMGMDRWGNEACRRHVRTIRRPGTGRDRPVVAVVAPAAVVVSAVRPTGGLRRRATVRRSTLNCPIADTFVLGRAPSTNFGVQGSLDGVRRETSPSCTNSVAGPD